MEKKSVELSINTMIIFALGLAVLVVIFVIFTKSSATYTKGVLTCDSKGGDCVPEYACQYEKTAFSCSIESEVCCINLLKV